MTDGFAYPTGADDFDAFALEDVVEGAAELAVAVVDQEADRRRSLAQRPGELPGPLDSPATIRVRSAASEVNAARAEFEMATLVAETRTPSPASSPTMR